MTVTFFGKGKCDEDSFEYKTALEISSALASKGISIAGGGYGGVMEAALKGAEGHNVARIGITCNELKDRKPNKYITEHIITETYMQRLERLVLVGDAYIILPGDTGTLLELAAVWALKKRKIANKPVVCIGEQWRNIIETVGFYSVNALGDMSLVKFAVDSAEAVKLITKTLKV